MKMAKNIVEWSTRSEKEDDSEMEQCIYMEFENLNNELMENKRP